MVVVNALQLVTSLRTWGWGEQDIVEGVNALKSASSLNLWDWGEQETVVWG